MQWLNSKGSFLDVKHVPNTWMRNPFVVKAHDVLEENLSALEQELLIELSCDETLKSTFRGQTLLDFEK